MGVADAKGRRFDAATGIGFAILAFIGFLLPGQPPKADDPASKIVSFASDHHGSILTGDFLVGVSAVLFLWFVGSLRSYLRSGEGGEGRLSAAAFGAGVAGIALLLAGVALFNTMTFKLAGTPGADPNVIRALFDASSALFAMASFAFAVFLAAASCSAARSGSLPPWAYWSGSAVAVIQLAAAISLVAKSGFFATGGALSIIAPVLAILWVLVISVVMVRRDGVPPEPRTAP